MPISIDGATKEHPIFAIQSISANTYIHAILLLTLPKSGF
jgi:hypothetical protein